eukprot:12063315-Karenia_brevis.AAC.1
MSSKKAQRVSWSTSHSETNPAVSCAAISNLVANRFTELDFFTIHARKITVKDRLKIHAMSLNHISVDICTDAMNLFELIVHKKTLPNDKHHRVGILALREDRMIRRIRNVVHIPTSHMLADPLTKRMTSRIFLIFVTTGIWKLDLKSEQKVRLRRG